MARKTSAAAISRLFRDSAPVFPDICVSSQVTVSRNMAGVPFPDSQTDEARVRNRDELFAKLHRTFPGSRSFALDAVPEGVVSFWRDAGALPPSLDRLAGMGLFRATDGRGREWFLRVNGGDFVDIVSRGPGFSITGRHSVVDEIDDALDGSVLPYAFDDELGYLSPDPANLGTALHVSVCLAVPGLFLSGDLDATRRALERLGFDARSAVGDGGDMNSALMAVSNSQTLGESEEDILRRMQRVVHGIARQETWARMRLAEGRSPWLANYFARAVGTGKYCVLATAAEEMELRAAARIGLSLGLLHSSRSGRDDDARPMVPVEPPDNLPDGRDDADQFLEELHANAVRDCFSFIDYRGF